MTAVAYILVGFGGAVGGGSRFMISDIIGIRLGTSFPWGTLIVNVSGALIIGAFAGFPRLSVSSHEHALVTDFFVTGVLGGYTTVSSFCMQTINLILNGKNTFAAFNIVGSTVLCLLAVAGGYYAASNSW